MEEETSSTTATSTAVTAVTHPNRKLSSSTPPTSKPPSPSLKTGLFSLLSSEKKKRNTVMGSGLADQFKQTQAKQQYATVDDSSSSKVSGENDIKKNFIRHSLDHENLASKDNAKESNDGGESSEKSARLSQEMPKTLPSQEKKVAKVLNSSSYHAETEDNRRNTMFNASISTNGARYAASTVRQSKQVAKERIESDLFNPKEAYSFNGLQEAASAFERNSLEFVASVNESILANQLRPKGLPSLPISASGKKIQESVRFVAAYAKHELENYKQAMINIPFNSWQQIATDTVSRIASALADKMKDIPDNGTVDLTVVAAATSNNQMAKKLVLANLAQKLSNDSQAVRSLGIQMCALLKYISQKLDDKPKEEKDLEKLEIKGESPVPVSPSTSKEKTKEEIKKEKELLKKEQKEKEKQEKERQKAEKAAKKAEGKRKSNDEFNFANLKPREVNTLILQMIILSKSFFDAMINLLNDVETLKYINNLQDDTTPKNSMKNLKNKFEQLSAAPANTKLVISKEPSKVQVIESEDNPFLIMEPPTDVALSTLDQLICYLTTAHDKEFTKTFITTYRSFSTPQVLLEKILLRYKSTLKMPKEKEKDADAIQVKIIIVLKYWMEAQIDDFDEDLLTKLNDLIDEMQKDGNQRPKQLKNVLDKKVAERNERTRLMLSKPDQIELPALGTTPVNVILDNSALSIAQQLTIIDYNLYKNIKVTELLNQSWNSPKLKYRSPNLIAMISRSTKLSFWIASCILSLNLDMRVALLEKVVDVCQHLVEMNNYNTLMGILGGLSLASVYRLKATFASLSAERKKMLARFQEIMSTDSSCKNYRAALKTAQPPVIPYIGISLTDLTFIETGNQDTVQDKVNYRKREMIYKAIQEVILYQNNQYSITPKEPLHALLSELPHTSNENDLYSLSLFFEPRETSTA